MSLLGGKKLTEAVTLVMRALMCPDLRTKFNAQKAKDEKLAFKSTFLFKVVVDAIHKRPLFKQTPVTEILHVMGSLFSRSGDENGGRERRRENAAFKRAAIEAFKKKHQNKSKSLQQKNQDDDDLSSS